MTDLKSHLTWVVLVVLFAYLAPLCIALGYLLAVLTG